LAAKRILWDEELKSYPGIMQGRIYPCFSGSLAGFLMDLVDDGDSPLIELYVVSSLLLSAETQS